MTQFGVSEVICVLDKSPVYCRYANVQQNFMAHYMYFMMHDRNRGVLLRFLSTLQKNLHFFGRKMMKIAIPLCQGVD